MPAYLDRSASGPQFAIAHRVQTYKNENTVEIAFIAWNHIITSWQSFYKAKVNLKRSVPNFTPYSTIASKNVAPIPVKVCAWANWKKKKQTFSGRNEVAYIPL